MLFFHFPHGVAKVLYRDQTSFFHQNNSLGNADLQATIALPPLVSVKHSLTSAPRECHFPTFPFDHRLHRTLNLYPSAQTPHLRLQTGSHQDFQRAQRLGVETLVRDAANGQILDGGHLLHWNASSS